jgi:hypothetical protein
MVINTIRNWVHFQPMRRDNMHPKRPGFFHLGGWWRCGWGSFAIWCFQMYTIWFLHVSIKCSLVLYNVPNLFLKFTIAAYFIPCPLLPKFLTIYVVQRKYYIRSILGVAKFAYNTSIIRPCVGCICFILEVCQSGHWVFRVWWWTKQRGWLFPPCPGKINYTCT